jgi:hypothetical protein
MEFHDADDTTERQQYQAPSSKAGRPPPIVLVSQVNLIQLQGQLKGLLKDNFEFCDTENGTKFITKEIIDFSAIRSHVDSNNLPYFKFYPESQKPIKAAIRHLPVSTPAKTSQVGW